MSPQSAQIHLPPAWFHLSPSPPCVLEVGSTAAVTLSLGGCTGAGEWVLYFAQKSPKPAGPGEGFHDVGAGAWSSGGAGQGPGDPDSRHPVDCRSGRALTSRPRCTSASSTWRPSLSATDVPAPLAPGRAVLGLGGGPRVPCSGCSYKIIHAHPHITHPGGEGMWGADVFI